MKVAETKTTASAQHPPAKSDGLKQPFFQNEKAGNVLETGQPSLFFPNGSDGIQRRPFFARPTVQPKLRIGPPGDKYEQEADGVADKVVQRLAQTENGSEQPLSTARPALQRKPIFESESAREVQTKPINGHVLHVPQLQKKCAECEQEENLQEMEAPGEEERLQRKPIFDNATPPPEELGEGVQRKSDARAGNSALQLKCADCAAEEGESVQRQETADGASTAPAGLTSRLDRSKGRGSPLSKDTRAQMEDSFGTDFSGVRVHTDSSAVQMSQELGAQAFTHGSDIYFNKGKFDTAGASGQHLLAHELTHTVQQGAVVHTNEAPQVQKDGDSDPVQEAASKVYDALDGWTDSGDSEIILSQFASTDKSTTDNIVSAVASKAGDSISYVYDWMYGDMVTSDWNNLFSHFKKVNAYRTDHLIASQVYSYLSGYTSASNSNSILAIYTTNTAVTGDLLGRSLIQLEAVTENTRSDAAEYLFGDLTLLDANKLSLHFFGSGDTTAAGYAAHWIAVKVRDLIAGFTGLADSEAIVGNFERTPAELRSKVLYELEQLCQAKWGQTAADAMMKDMWQSDYEKLRTFMPGLLPIYSIERNWLEWTWERLMDGYDFLSALVEYGVCGLIGVIWGVLTVVGDIFVAVVDLVVAVKDLLGLIVYAISGGKFCRENKEKVYGFFTAMGQIFDAPGDAISAMWDELTAESSLIEGPFSACKKAVFWTSRVINLAVNIVLIIAAGYGAVKIALKGIEAVVSLARAGELVGALKALPGKLWGSIKKLPGAASKGILTGASKVIGLLKNPVEIIGAARNTLTAVRLAVGDEGYFKFLRSQLGEALEGESQFWRKRREVWKRSADEIEPRLNTTESKLATAVETTVDDPAKASAKISEAEIEAKTGKSEADELMGEVNGTKATKESSEPVLAPKLTAGDFYKNPNLLWGKTHTELGSILKADGWTQGVYEGTSNAYTFSKSTPGGKMEIVINYGGGRHFKGQVATTPSYYKISGAGIKRTKVIDVNTYPAPDMAAEASRFIDGATGKVVKQ